MTGDRETAVPAAVTWQDIGAIIESRGGAYGGAIRGSRRWWSIPAPGGGELIAGVTLRPRWCGIDLDRICAGIRGNPAARPWLEEHIWPHVANPGKGGYPVQRSLPGGGVFTWAYPLDRAAVPGLLAAWLDMELACYAKAGP
jgi:hypothetical protein